MTNKKARKGEKVRWISDYYSDEMNDLIGTRRNIYEFSLSPDIVDGLWCARPSMNHECTNSPDEIVATFAGAEIREADG